MIIDTMSVHFFGAQGQQFFCSVTIFLFNWDTQYILYRQHLLISTTEIEYIEYSVCVFVCAFVRVSVRQEGSNESNMCTGLKITLAVNTGLFAILNNL